MEWVHVSDLVDGRHVDPDFISKMLAYIEAKTVYETLSKVLELLYKAKERGLVDPEASGHCGRLAERGRARVQVLR